MIIHESNKINEGTNYDLSKESDQKKACEEYAKCMQNNLSSSAENRMTELDKMARNKGLKFVMTNYDAYVQPNALVKPKFKLVKESLRKKSSKINEASVTQSDLDYIDDLLHYAVKEFTKNIPVKLVSLKTTENFVERIVKFPIKYIGNVTAESSPEDIANALSSFAKKKGHRILDTYVRKDYVSVETKCKGERSEVLGNAYFTVFWDPASVRYKDPNSIYIETSVFIKDLLRNKVKLVSY